MASYNRVTLLGNLGQDPELRYTQNQTSVTSFSIATTEYRKSADGGNQSVTDWHRIVVWGRQAENCSKYLRKGQPVFIEGRLQTRTWEDQSGQKHRTTEVVAGLVQFIGQSDRRGSSPTNGSRSRLSTNNPGLGNDQQDSPIDEVPF